ncbi:MAG: hypothetical protein AAB870_03955 [Patescibacteria group bacterium]
MITQSRLADIANIERDQIVGDITPIDPSRYIAHFDRTGEVLIVGKQDNGEPIILSEKRFTDGKSATPTTDTILAVDVVSREDSAFNDNIDYRGEKVIGVSRYMKDRQQWVVVKMDRDEADEALFTLFNSTLLIGLILVVLGVTFFATLVTQSIIAPIRELTDITRAISLGNMHAFMSQAMLAAKDEVGDLSRAFDRTVVSLKLAMMSNQKKDTEEVVVAQRPRKKQTNAQE